MAESFPITHNEPEDSFTLTPRTCAMLDNALSWFAASLTTEIEDVGSQPLRISTAHEFPVLGQLPPFTWKMNRQWRRNLMRAAHDLSEDISENELPIPTCPAEEALLLLAIRDCENQLQDGPENLEWLTEYPQSPEDFDWDTVTDNLMQDGDMEMILWSPLMDGIEDPGNVVNQRMDIGDLRPGAWFEPFGNVTPRNPHRPYPTIEVQRFALE